MMSGIILNINMLNVIMLNVIMLSVVMLNVVAPFGRNQSIADGSCSNKP